MPSAMMLLVALSGSQAQEQKETPKEVPQVKGLPAGTQQFVNLAYVEKGHERHKLDLFIPQSAKPTPLIVWIHGGGWVGGSKNSAPSAKEFLEAGYAVASINYRFSNHAVYPAQIFDSKAAVRFLRANAKKYNIDPDHIGVWGASAGGHLVSLLGTTSDIKELEGDLGNLNVSSRVQAVVDVFGPADFMKYAEHSGSNSVFGANSLLSKLLGGPIPDNKELAKMASPALYCTKDDAPFLILQGDKDLLVPHQQSREFHDALKKAGVESTLIIVPGAGHDARVFGSGNREKVGEFFAKYLKKS